MPRHYRHRHNCRMSSLAVRLFTPEGHGPWPGIVMIPDAGGVRQTFFDMAARLADLGYAVLLPDVYYRQGDWAPFDMKTAFTDDNERKRLMSFIGSVTPDDWASDANAYFDYLAARPEVSGSTFGITGYCMGGRTALIVAGRVPDRVAAATSFHGGGLVTDGNGSPHLMADQIQAVVYVGGAENDKSFTATTPTARQSPYRGRCPAHDRDVCGRPRLCRARQPVVRRRRRRAALDGDARGLRSEPRRLASAAIHPTAARLVAVSS